MPDQPPAVLSQGKPQGKRRARRKHGRPLIEVAAPDAAAQIIPAFRETGSLTKTAAKVGLSRPAVTSYLRRRQPDFTAARKAFAASAMVQGAALIDAGYRRRKEMSAMQAVTAGAILVDKSLALAGDAPGQGPRVQVNAVVADLANTIQALRAAAEARRNAQNLSVIDTPTVPASATTAEPTQDQQVARGTSHNDGYVAGADEGTKVGEG